MSRYKVIVSNSAGLPVVACIENTLQAGLKQMKTFIEIFKAVGYTVTETEKGRKTTVSWENQQTFTIEIGRIE